MSYGPTWNDVKEDVYQKVQYAMMPFAYEANNESIRGQVKEAVGNEFNPALLAGLLHSAIVTVDDSKETLDNHELVVQVAWKVNAEDKATVAEFRIGPSGLSSPEEK